MTENQYRDNLCRVVPADCYIFVVEINNGSATNDLPCAGVVLFHGGWRSHRALSIE